MATYNYRSKREVIEAATTFLEQKKYCYILVPSCEDYNGEPVTRQRVAYVRDEWGNEMFVDRERSIPYPGFHARPE